MIIPTVGRIMWFFPNGITSGLTHHDKTQPLAAMVCHVVDEHTVNLDVVDSIGVHHSRLAVPIIQDGSPHTVSESFHAEWMPYQKDVAAGKIPPMQHASQGQVVKTDELERPAHKEEPAHSAKRRGHK